MNFKEMNYKDWIVVVLTAVFVTLYVFTLAGWIQPPRDDKLVAQIASIITAIIGYHFARIPGEKHEQTLQKQVDDTRDVRKQAESQRDEAQAERKRAEGKRDEAQTERNDAIEQRAKFAAKIAAAKAALSAVAPTDLPEQLAATLGGIGTTKADAEAVRKAAAAALKALESP